MTDDLVARLRYEQELCAVMGDTKAGTLVGEAADRLEAAEARVRELEALNAALNERAAQYERLYRDAKAETIERCAKVADKIADEHAKWKGDAVSADAAEQVATAIRKLGQEVK